MRNKEIKNMLIEKANRADIPNVASQIKARFNEIPHKPVIEQQYKRPMVLVKVMALSMLVVFAVTLGLIYGFRDIDPLSSSDDSLHDAVMLSSISTLSLIDDIEATAVSSSTATLLVGGQNAENSEETLLINNAEGLRKYLFMLESLLKSEGSYNYQRKVINRNEGKYQLQFQTSSLLDKESNYVVIYEVTDDSESTTAMTLTTYGYSEAYQSYLTYQRRTGVITMTTAINDEQTVKISYSEDANGKHYQITRYENLMIAEQVQMNFTSSQDVNLSFVRGNVYGTYEFSLTVDEKGIKRVIAIDYNIQNQYYGMMSVFVTGDNNENYTTVIRTSNGQTYSVTSARQRGRN